MSRLDFLQVCYSSSKSLGRCQTCCKTLTHLWHRSIGVQAEGERVRRKFSLQPFAYLWCIHCEGGEKEKAFMLCKHCSAIVKILVCFQHWFGHTSKPHSTIQPAVKKINSLPCRLSTPAQPSTWANESPYGSVFQK